MARVWSRICLYIYRQRIRPIVSRLNHRSKLFREVGLTRPSGNELVRATVGSPLRPQRSEGHTFQAYRLSLTHVYATLTADTRQRQGATTAIPGARCSQMQSDAGVCTRCSPGCGTCQPYRNCLPPRLDPSYGIAMPIFVSAPPPAAVPAIFSGGLAWVAPETHALRLSG